MFRVTTVSGYDHGLGTDYRRNPRHHCMVNFLKLLFFVNCVAELCRNRGIDIGAIY